eukprot:s765_g27.t1
MTARNRSVTTSCGRDVLLPFECRLYSGSGINGRFFTAEIKILKANATVPFLARISDHFGTAFCCFFVFAWFVCSSVWQCLDVWQLNGRMKNPHEFFFESIQWNIATFKRPNL